MEFEVCIDSLETAIIAGKYGAKRVELCSALSEGGLTPSAGMIHTCATASQSEVYVMIRPRAGGFTYSEDELKIMHLDIQIAAEAGAKGVVFGVLTDQNRIAIKENMLLMEEALKYNLGTTFHRAIDLCPHPPQALEDLINIGFDRVLTSGTRPKALQGIETITELVKQSADRIAIMAGSGINAKNISEFQKINELHAVHFTARKPLTNTLELDMGTAFTTDEEKIIAIQRLLLNS